MGKLTLEDLADLVSALTDCGLGIADTATNGLDFAPPDSVLGQVGAGIGAGFALVGIGIAGSKFYQERQKLKSGEPPANALLAGASGSNKHTKHFLLERINKDFAGASASAAGSAVSAVSQVNVLGAIKNASSLATTSMHLHKLEGMRGKLTNASKEVMHTVIETKRIKAGGRAGALASDLIPSAVPAAGAVVGTAAAVATAIMRMNKESQWILAAKTLHCEAHNNRSGPEFAIARELLTQRGISAVGSKLGIPGFGAKRAKTVDYMKEPAGWLVLLDKISAA